MLKDCGSRHGLYVNGQRVTRHALRNSDRIEFGAQDSYALVFALDGAELKRLIEQMGAPRGAAPLAPCRAWAATWPSCAPSSTWRAPCKARSPSTTFWPPWWMPRWRSPAPSAASCCCAPGTGWRSGWRAPPGRPPPGGSDLQVPREVIASRARTPARAVPHELRPARRRPRRRPRAAWWTWSCAASSAFRWCASARARATPPASCRPEAKRWACCISIRALAAADLAGGNRELIQTLAIEASTVLENARLLEEERAKQRLDEELSLARTIQQSLLPAHAAQRAAGCAPAGSSVASRDGGRRLLRRDPGEPAIAGRRWWRMFPAKAPARRCWPLCCKAR